MKLNKIARLQFWKCNKNEYLDMYSSQYESNFYLRSHCINKCVHQNHNNILREKTNYEKYSGMGRILI